MASSATHHPAAFDEAPPGLLRRAIAAAAIGNATEWFDYGIYAYGVTYISAALFPGSTDQATLSRSRRSPSRSSCGRSAASSGVRWATGSAARRCWR